MERGERPGDPPLLGQALDLAACRPAVQPRRERLLGGERGERRRVEHAPQLPAEALGRIGEPPMPRDVVLGDLARHLGSVPAVLLDRELPLRHVRDELPEKLAVKRAQTDRVTGRGGGAPVLRVHCGDGSAEQVERVDKTGDVSTPKVPCGLTPQLLIFR